MLKLKPNAATKQNAVRAILKSVVTLVVSNEKLEAGRKVRFFFCVFFYYKR
jgi:hypothetical protein